MDEVLLKQLIRQIKVLNFWITLFGTLFLIVLLVSGFLLFQLVTFMRDTKQSIEGLQNSTSQTLDIQKRVCGSNLKDLLGEDGDYCK
ncbi:MAG: hypothetical protein M3Q36_02935 [bacterium]|nr:hypothetical protein [bacterium]